MTCIIAHADGWMVADRRQTFENSLIGPYETNKIKRAYGGILVASAGNGVFQDLIQETIDGKFDWDALNAVVKVFREKGSEIGGHALALVRDSIFEITSRGGCVKLTAPFWAIGSGYPFALGYLERCARLGKVTEDDAVAAIEFASTRVNDVGDGVQVERLAPLAPA